MLGNSYFTRQGTHYQQVSSSAMGSPVSAMVADLVICNIEGPHALSRYVDDSNVCLKKTDADILLQYLNSIDGKIQFTIKHLCQTVKGRSISFLDSRITVLGDGSVEDDVYLKATHINKYLDFTSHNPAQHREAGVRTLLDRANFLPSRPELSANERNRFYSEWLSC